MLRNTQSLLTVILCVDDVNIGSNNGRNTASLSPSLCACSLFMSSSILF